MELTAEFSPVSHRRGQLTMLVVVALGFGGLLLHHIRAHYARGDIVTGHHVVFVAIAEALPWIAATPAIVELVRRRGLHLPREVRSPFLLMGAGVALSFVVGSLEFWIRSAAPTAAEMASRVTWAGFLQNSLLPDLSISGVLALLAHLREFRALHLASAGTAHKLSGELTELRAAGAVAPLTRLQVETNGRIHLVALDSIDWMEAAGNYVVLHAGRARYIYGSSLRALEKRIDKLQFVRVHRSTIVNLARVQEMSHWASGDYRLTLKSGAVLRLSRTYRPAFDELTGRSR